MKLGIELTVDLVFKKIFGSQENKSILIDIVNAVLEKANQEQVIDLEILNHGEKPKYPAH
jgi:hypothetical protein